MAQPKATTDAVATQEQAATAGLASIPPAVQQMMLDLRRMSAEAATENGTAADISMDILERILTADTLEEAAGATTDLDTLIQVPVAMYVKTWVASEIGELGVFAVLSCVDDQGHDYTVTCGARNIVAIAYRAQKEGRTPLRGMFRAVETRAGFTTYWFDILAD